MELRATFTKEHGEKSAVLAATEYHFHHEEQEAEAHS